MTTNPPPSFPAETSGSRILLAEDDESMRGFLERALQRAGHEVASFANGEEAFERLKAEPFFASAH